ncbi:MAG: hypothetical protein MRY32_07775 [Rickettsiales bacterium]|nr:hypothetical protein [Rickettsiales bacterium]
MARRLSSSEIDRFYMELAVWVDTLKRTDSRLEDLDKLMPMVPWILSKESGHGGNVSMSSQGYYGIAQTRGDEYRKSVSEVNALLSAKGISLGNLSYTTQDAHALLKKYGVDLPGDGNASARRLHSNSLGDVSGQALHLAMEMRDMLLGRADGKRGGLTDYSLTELTGKKPSELGVNDLYAVWLMGPSGGRGFLKAMKEKGKDELLMNATFAPGRPVFEDANERSNGRRTSHWGDRYYRNGGVKYKTLEALGHTGLDKSDFVQTKFGLVKKYEKVTMGEWYAELKARDAKHIGNIPDRYLGLAKQSGPGAERTEPEKPPQIDVEKAKEALGKLSISEFNMYYSALRKRAETYNNTPGLAADKKVSIPAERKLVDPSTVTDDPSTPENEKEAAQKVYDTARSEMTDQIIETTQTLQDNGNLTQKTEKEEKGETSPDSDPQKQHQTETERRDKEKRKSDATDNTRSHLNGPGNEMPDDILILLLLLMLIAPEAALQIWNWYMSGKGNNVNNGPSDSTRNRIRNGDDTPRRNQGIETQEDVEKYRNDTNPNTERFKTKTEFENGGHNRSLFGSGIPSEVNGEKVNYVPGVTHQIPFKKDGPRFQQFGIRVWDSNTQSKSKVLYYIADKETGKVIYSAVYDSGGKDRNAAPGTNQRDILAEIANDPAKRKLWEENPIIAQLSQDDVKGYLNTPHSRDQRALDQARVYMLGLPAGADDNRKLENVRDIIARGVKRLERYQAEKDKTGFDPKSIPGLTELPESMRIINFNPSVMDKLEIDPADIAKGKLSLPKLDPKESRIALYVGHGYFNGAYDPGTTGLTKQVERAARAAGITGVDFRQFDEHNVAAELMREIKTQLMLKTVDGVRYRDDQVFVVQATREMRFNAKNGYAPFRAITRQTNATVHLEGHFNHSGSLGVGNGTVEGAAMYFYTPNRPTPEGKALADKMAQYTQAQGLPVWKNGVVYQSTRLGMMSGSLFKGMRRDGGNVAHGLIEGDFLDNPKAFARYVEEVKDASGRVTGYRLNRNAIRELASAYAAAIHDYEVGKGRGPGKALNGVDERPPPYAYYVEDLPEGKGLEGSGPPRPYQREKLTRRELADEIIRTLPSGTAITNNDGPITAILDSQGRLVGGNKPFERVDPASTAKHAVVLALIKMDEAGKLPKDFWKDPKNITDLKMISLPRGTSLSNYNRATQRLVARAMGIDVPANGSVGADHQTKMASFINTYLNGKIVDELGLVDTHFSDRYMVAERGGFKGYSGLVGMNTEKGGDDGNYVTAYDGVRIQQALAKYSSNPAYGKLIDNLLASGSGSLGTISNGFSGDKAQWVAKTGTAGGDYGPKREGQSDIRAFVAAHKTNGVAFGVYETHKSKIGDVVGNLRVAALRNQDGVDIQALKRQIIEQRIEQQRVEIERQQVESKQPSRHEFYPGDSALSGLKLSNEPVAVVPVTGMPTATLRELIQRHYPQHHTKMNELAGQLGIADKLDIKMTSIDYMKFITGRTDLLSADLQKQIGELPKAFKDSLYERGQGDGTPLARFNMSGGKAPYCAGTIANALMLSYPEIAAAWQRKDVFDNLSGYHQSEIEGENIGDGKYKYGKIVDVQAFFTVGQKLGLLQTKDDGSPATYGDIKYADLKEGSIIAFAPPTHRDRLASPKGEAKSGASGHHLAMIVGKGEDARGEYVLIASGNNGHGPKGEAGQSGLHTYKAYKRPDGTIRELGGSKRPVAWHMPPERLQAYHELYNATAERIRLENQVRTESPQVRQQVVNTDRFSVLDGILIKPERELQGLLRMQHPIKQGHVYDPNAKWYAFGDSSAVLLSSSIEKVSTFTGSLAQSSAGVIPFSKRPAGSALLLEQADWNTNLPKIGKDSHANILVSMGYNDVGLNASATQIMDKMRPIMDKMIADGTNPVITGLHSGSKHYTAAAQEKIKSLNKLLETYAVEKGLVFVDVAAIESKMGADKFLHSDNLHMSEDGKKAVFAEAERLLADAAKKAQEAAEEAKRATKRAELLRPEVDVETKPQGVAKFEPAYNLDGKRNGRAKKTYADQEWLGLTTDEQKAKPWLQEKMGADNGENERPVVNTNAYREGGRIEHRIPRTPQKGVPVIPTSLYKYANEEGWIGFKIADEYGLTSAGRAAAIGQIGMYNIRTGEYKVHSFGSGGKGGIHEGQKGAPSPTLVSHDTWHKGPDADKINGVSYVGSYSHNYTGSKSGDNFGPSVDWIDAVYGRGDTMGHKVFGTPERIAGGRFSQGCEAIVNSGAFINDLVSTKMNRAGARFFVLNKDVERLPVGERVMPKDKVPEEWRWVRDLSAEEFRNIKTMSDSEFLEYQKTRKASLHVPGSGTQHAYLRAGAVKLAGVSVADPEKVEKEDNSLAAAAVVRATLAEQLETIRKQDLTRVQNIAFASVDDPKKVKGDDQSAGATAKLDGEVKDGTTVTPTEVTIASADTDQKKKDQAVASATA